MTVRLRKHTSSALASNALEMHSDPATRLAYFAMIALLAVGLVGLSYIRYAVYSLPVILFAIWGVSKSGKIYLTSLNGSFLLLIALAVLYFPTSGTHAWKWTFFVFVYVTSFMLFDFSRIEFDVRRMNVFFFLIFLISVALGGAKPFKAAAITSAVLDSSFGVESTFSFMFGLFAVFFFLQKKFLWFLINVAAAVLTFKRIVLVALIAFLLVRALPFGIRRFVVRPTTITVIVLLGIVLGVEFGSGQFDDYLLNLTGKSANYLSMGRRDLWGEALRFLQFNYVDFAFVGQGLEKVLGLIAEASSRNWLLLHNDLLLIYLAYGAVALVLFVWLFMNQGTIEERMLALFLLVVLITDNVLIYQHVICLYLLLQAALRRSLRNARQLTNREGSCVFHACRPVISP